MKLELTSNGLDDILREVIEILESAHQSNSKHTKDLRIHTAIGYIDALYKMILTREDEEV